MRKLFILLMLAGYCTASSQGLTQAKAEELYGPRTQITTTKASDQSLNETTTTSYIDKDGIVRRKEESVTDMTGKKLHTRITEHSLSGKITKATYTTYGDMNTIIDNSNTITTITETREYDRKGGVTSHTVTSDGWNLSSDRHRATTYDVMSGQGTKPFKDWQPQPRAVFENQDNRQSQSCIPKLEAFAGYSFLSADYGTERESYPLGLNASLAYNFGGKFSAIADASVHSKKDNDYKWTQFYVGVGGQYDFGSEANCSNPIKPFANILAGFYTDGFHYNGDKLYSECAFSMMAGGGLDYMMNERFALRFQTHAIFPEIGKENAPVNIRISAGLAFAFGQPPKF